MNSSMVEKIAKAILYEGYLLYPYRHSALKNRQRFNFGVLSPKNYGEKSRGADHWQMQTECLLEGKANSALEIKVRFLQIVRREIGKSETPPAENSNDTSFQKVPSPEIEGKLFQTSEEAVEREISFVDVKLSEILKSPQKREFSFPASEKIEYLTNAKGETLGVIVRKTQTISGLIEFQIFHTEIENLYKITVKVSNLTQIENAYQQNRDEIMRSSFVSVHTVLSVESGEFVSLLEPPEIYREIAESCQNVATFPVLVGAENARNCVLSSPIILYDYPNIAPESAGDLFDGLEIDEMLTLRIMTLTDEEKREMRDADERTKMILERSETLLPEQMLKMHGALRLSETFEDFKQ